MQEMYNDGFIHIIQTPKGPHVYLGNSRIHYWMPGVILGGIALLGAILDDNKKNREKHAVLGLVGALLVLDDLPDFISFLQGKRYPQLST